MRNRRPFRPDEDDLIRQQSQGKISVNFLEKNLRCARETIMRRAEELGVTLIVRPQKGGKPRRRHEGNGVILQGATEEDLRMLVTDHGSNPYHVGRDLLLQRLHIEHGERRYEALQIKTKETQS